MLDGIATSCKIRESKASSVAANRNCARGKVLMSHTVGEESGMQRRCMGYLLAQAA